MVSKCVKFENGLRPEIYQYICFHEIRDFDTLVHSVVCLMMLGRLI